MIKFSNLQDIVTAIRGTRKLGISVETIKNSVTVQAANHLYDCRCLDCLVYFACTGMVVKDENDPEYDSVNDAGPFTLEEINTARKELDMEPMPRLPRFDVDFDPNDFFDMEK